jgi:hypothetical protein
MRLIITNEQQDLTMIEVAKLSIRGDGDSVSFVDTNGDHGEVIVSIKTDINAIKESVLKNVPVIVVRGNVVNWGDTL